MRDRSIIEKRCLAVLLSISMVFELAPSPALAEAVDMAVEAAVAASDESSVVVDETEETSAADQTDESLMLVDDSEPESSVEAEDQGFIEEAGGEVSERQDEEYLAEGELGPVGFEESNAVIVDSLADSEMPANESNQGEISLGEDEDAQESSENAGEADSDAIELVEDTIEEDAPALGADAEEPLDSQATWQTSGTCEWSIDSNGVLTVRPKNGSVGTLDWWEYDDGVPWYSQRKKIVKVRFQKTVKALTCQNMFSDCGRLTSANLSGLNTSSVTDMSSMFYECPRLTTVGLLGVDTSSVMYMDKMFSGCYSLESLNASGLDTSSVTTMSEMFRECYSLKSLDVSKWKTGSVTNMNQAFHGCPLKSLDVSKWDMSSVIDMSDMFNSCDSLNSLDVSKWDTSSVTNMDGVFDGCSSLTSLDVSKWDTSSVTNMRDMFSGCSSLKRLDVSGWDVSSVGIMGSNYDNFGMFHGCSSIESLDVSKWDTSALVDMSGLFYGCSSLRSIDVSRWDTSAVTDVSEMFYGCSSLTSIDFSSWDTFQCLGVHTMLCGCSSLRTMKLGRYFAFPDGPYDYSSYSSGDGPQFPIDTWWKSSKTGKRYKFGNIPKEVAATYTRVPDVFYATVKIPTQTYTGKAIKPTPKVTLDGKTLKAGTDYTLKYKNNVNVPNQYASEDDLPTVTITGKGNYVGTQTVTFKIKPAPISKATVSKIADAAYNGSEQRPNPTVKFGGKTLSNGRDYEISWSNNVKVGNKAKVILTGMGNFTGTKAVTFRIAFSDVPKSHPFYSKIHRANDLGIINGYDKDRYGQFGPGDNITRGQIAVMLWSAAKKPKPKAGAKSFPDAKPGAYYYEAVMWASSVGVVNGYKDGKFGPNDNITREQLAVMIANYASKVGKKRVSGSKADLAKLGDAKSVSGFATGSVAWCYKNKIYVLQSGKLNPTKTADRATAAQMACDLYDFLH